MIFASCGEKYFTHNGSTWGTSFHIVYKSDRPIDSLIDSAMRVVDDEFSMFNPASTVSAINRGDTDTVSRAFAELFDLALKINGFSDGAYDPTVAPLTHLWGFGKNHIEAEPSDSSVAEALRTVGIAQCRIDHGHIIKKDAATEFDFSSIAKGYGVDLVGRMLESHGIADYMVEIGGEVRASGLSDKRRPWRIQIDAPTGGLAHTRLMVVELGPERCSMASSGNYRNYRTDSDGNIYGHTISPLSGRPVAGEVIAATVICADCAEADALATACMASPAESDAQRVIDRAGASVLLVIASGDSLQCVTTRDFDRYIMK
ncbi:MAG: FAD:protein FMN transferase [Muribaculaceae bacterium]|nr:FAD:protein FMN transferase [Muribaculaceae bacterium]